MHTKIYNVRITQTIEYIHVCRIDVKALLSKVIYFVMLIRLHQKYKNEVLYISVIANTDGIRDYGDRDLVVHMLQRQRWCETIAYFNEHSSLEGY